MDNELILGALELALLFFSAYLVVYFVIKLDRFLLKIKNFIVKLEWMVNTLQHYAYVILFLFIIALALTLYNTYCTIELIVYGHQCKKDTSKQKKMRLNLFKYIFGINRLAKNGTDKIKRLLKRAKRARKWALIAAIIALIATIILYGMVWVFHNMLNQYTVINYYTMTHIVKKSSDEEYLDEKDDERHLGEEGTTESSDTEQLSETYYGEDWKDLGDMQYSAYLDNSYGIVPKYLADDDEYRGYINSQGANKKPEITLLIEMKDGTELWDIVQNVYEKHKDDTPDDKAKELIKKDAEACSYEVYVMSEPNVYLHPDVLSAVNEVAKEEYNIVSDETEEKVLVGKILAHPGDYGIKDTIDKVRSEN